MFTVDMTSWISAWRRDTKLFEYCVLITSMVFSAVGSFLISCGGSLMAHASWPFSIGHGMFWAGLAMAAVWRRKAPKGSVGVLPVVEAKAEIQEGMQVIAK